MKILLKIKNSKMEVFWSVNKSQIAVLEFCFGINIFRALFAIGQKNMRGIKDWIKDQVIQEKEEMDVQLVSSTYNVK